ncbi:MAG: G8 domain-containing protein [Candidatus Binataceae bacterium]
MAGQTDCTDAYVGDNQMLRGAGALGTVTIQSGGTLVFLDQSDSIEVGSIIVETGGTLQIGAKTCPIQKSDQIQIIFTGGEGASKGIDVKAGATLRMWGSRGNTAFGNVSWAHLSTPAGPTTFSKENKVASPVPGGAEMIDVDKALPSWKVGDWIVVAGTDFAPDSSEIVQIAAITVNAKAGTTAITTMQPLVNYHFGGSSPTCATGDLYCGPSPASFKDGADKNYGIDERAEVGLLNKSIQMTSITPNPYQNKTLISPQPTGLHWGGTVLLEAGFAVAEVAGVEISKFGGDHDGHFPIYVTGNGSTTPIISSNSIHHSYNKCIGLAGLTGTTTNPNAGATISDNVCARVVGDMFYLQTGAEQNLTFVHNLGIGAMSNAFTLNSAVTVPPYQAWWPGDNKTNNPTNTCPAPGDSSGFNCYDGFNVAFTDNASSTLKVYQTQPYASSGFWITNPANNLQANSIAGCQDQGIGFWYNLISFNGPQDPGTANFPLGTVTNNRAHGCYYGLNTPAQPPSTPGANRNGNYAPQNTQQLDLIAHFDGFTVTRNRYLGIWARPSWYAFTNSRLATNREGASLVSSGGIEGSPPGVWSQITGAVFVGESMNNPGRFGPCPYYADGLTPPAGVASPVCPEAINSAVQGNSYPDAKWNEFGYMFYDGPARIEDSNFINFLVDPTPLLTTYDATYLATYAAKMKMPCDPNTKFVYEGDAALGWFQANQQLYPPTQYTEGVSFENVDLRHQVYTQEVGVTCATTSQGMTTQDFQDGDKNTVILDHDWTLSGYQVVDASGAPVPGKFPISLNNLPFLAVADTTNGVLNTVDECYAEGAQDTVYENRPTAQMSPNDYASLEFSAVPCALTTGDFQACSNPNLMTFTKDQLDYGAHQTMALNGRNKNGIYEPKVMNGLGYTVQAQFEMPPFVSLTYTDAAVTPFQTRVGLCYTTPSGPVKCPSGDCSSVFTVSKGVKTLGSPGSTSLAALAPYFTFFNVCNGLDNQYGYPPGFNLPNLALCPNPTVVLASGTIPPTPTPLTAASSIAQLTPSTYFYDQTSGLLFLDVQQDLPNGSASYSPSGGGPSPLGACNGPMPDPACPDFAHGESFYSCPSGGCELYMVQVSSNAYPFNPTLAGTQCSPYPQYAQPYPTNLNLLKNVATGTVLTPTKLTVTGASGNFPHLVDASGAPCP